MIRSATLALVVGCMAPLPGASQESGDDATVLLGYSKVESVLESFGPSVSQALASLGIDMEPAAAAVLGAAMERDRLWPLMVDSFMEQGTPSEFSAARAMVEDAALRAVDSISAAAGSEPTIQEFAASLSSDPPSRERIQIVARMVQAQAAADFFVLMDEAAREAAHTVGAVLAADVPAFTPLGRDAWALQAQENFVGALGSFLYRYRDVPDPLLAQAVARWESPTGAWFVQAYSLALGATLRAAAENAVTELSDAGLVGSSPEGRPREP